jgi:hypothetical protein
MKRKKLKSLFLFLMTAIMIGISATQVCALEKEQYVAGDFFIITTYTLEDEIIKEVLAELPEHTIYLFSTSGGKDDQPIKQIYYLTLKDATRHAEAYKILTKFSDIVEIGLNYIYSPADDTESKSGSYHKGDLDQDGNITSTDYLKVKEMFLGSYALTASEKILADIDNDGGIDSIDYLSIKNHFLGNKKISVDGFYRDIDLSEFNSISDETILSQIKNDYIKTTYNPELYTEKDVDIDMIFGSFGGAYVMMIKTNDAAFPSAITVEKVGDVIFTYKDAQKLTVWKDGTFYSLSESYEDGILSDAQLIIISKLFVFQSAFN